MFDAIAFAGGGNRCYWQGGFYEAAAGRLRFPPRLVVGVSAGAFASVYCLLGIGAKVPVALTRPRAPSSAPGLSSQPSRR